MCVNFLLSLRLFLSLSNFCFFAQTLVASDVSQNKSLGMISNTGEVDELQLFKFYKSVLPFFRCFRVF